jgi:nitrate reductase gamma subunit
MGSVRNWAAGSAIAALVLLSPVVAFLTVIAAEIAVDGLMEAGATGVCAIAIGAVGCVLFRRILRSEIARQSASDEVCAAPPVAAPPG